MNPKKSSWHRLWILLAVLLILISSVPGLAQIGPETMNFQGRLLDSGGSPRGGETHCMRFRLCTNAASEADCTATKKWPVSVDYEYQGVTTESGTYKAGLFTVALGSAQPIPPALMFDSDSLYLEIGVSDDGAGCDGVDETYTVMSPASQLRANAFAQRSRRVRTEESDDDFLVSVGNTGQGGAVFGRTNSTTDDARAGYFYAAATSGKTYGVYGRIDTTATDASAVYGEASQATGQVHGLYGKTNSADGYGVYGSGPEVGVRGVGDTATSASPGVGVGVWGDSATGDGVWGVTEGTSNGARGVYGYASAAWGLTFGVYGEATSNLGTGVYGKGSWYGLYGEGSNATSRSYGVYGISTGTDGYGVWGDSTHRDGVVGRSTYGNGVHGMTTSGSDYGVFGESAWVGVKGVGGWESSVATAGDVGVWGDSNSGDGVWGTTDYTILNASGVLGWAKGATGQTSGVWGYNDSTSDGARGVYGYATAFTGDTIGVRGESLSSSGTGVYGTAPLTGTVGIATNVINRGVGVYGSSLSQSGVGVYAKATAYSGQTYGVYSVNYSSGDNAAAGFFWAKGTSGLNSGVYAANNSTSDEAAGGRFYAVGTSGRTYGVRAATDSSSTNASGVYGFSIAGATNGVWGQSQSTDSGSAGVYAHASNAGGAAVALWARSAGSGDIIRGYGAGYPDLEFKVENDGDVRADGTFASPAADLAEMLPAVAGLEPGDVLAIGPDGRLVRSSQAYQGSVAGVYSTRPAFLGGAAIEGDVEGHVPVAVVGVVPVKVSAENGAIRPGDLLAASSLPGHAMRAEPVELNGLSFYLPGTIIGKALKGWDAAQGTGVILVLVTLQ